jgi:hypothetical protein
MQDEPIRANARLALQEDKLGYPGQYICHEEVTTQNTLIIRQKAWEYMLLSITVNFPAKLFYTIHRKT